MKKKLISAVLTACLAATSLIGSVQAAPTYYNQNYSSYAAGTIAWNGHLTGSLAWNSGSGWGAALNASTYGAQFNILDGAYGKLSGDKVLKYGLFNPYSVRFLTLEPTSNTTDGATYYSQSSIYLSDNIPSGVVFRNGGEAYLGTSRKLAYFAFGADGKVYKDSRVADDNVRFDAYDQNNWYTITMAYTANNGVTNVMDVYIDGKKIDSVSVDGSAGTDAISKNYMRMGWENEQSTFATERFFAVYDDIKVVEGAFNPASANTDISSSAYTVANPTFLESGSVKEPKVSGIPNGKTAAEVEGNITAPAGGSVYVIRLSDDGTTTDLADTDIVDSDCILVSKASGGNVKLYTLDVEAPAAYEAELMSSVYTIDSENKVITNVPYNTSISSFLENVTASYAADVKLIGLMGEEVSEGVVNNNLKVRVTSYDGITVNDYNFRGIEKTTISDYRGSSSYLRDAQAGLIQKLIGCSGAEVDGIAYSGAASNARTSMAGFYGGTRSNFANTDTTSELKYSKVTDSEGVYAYQFENPTKYNVYRKLSNKTLVPYNEKTGDDIVIEYSIEPKAPGRYVMALDLLTATSDGGSDVYTFPEGVTGRATPNISFQTDNGVNNIKFGVRENADGWCTTIGTWEVNKKYDVAIALKKLDANTTDAYYIKGVWINGEKVANLGNGSVSGDYWKLNNSSNAQKAYATYTASSIVNDTKRNNHKGWAWNSVAFSAASADGVTPALVNYSEITTYMANGYNAPVELNVTSDSLEIYESDKILKVSTVKGFSGNVATLKAQLNVPAGLKVAVLDNGAVVSDSTPVKGGMYLAVYSGDYSQRKTYLLSDAIDMGKFELYDSTGFIPVESITDTDGALTVKRTVKKYNMEDVTEFTLVAAVYEKETGKLLDVEITNQDDYTDVDGVVVNLDLSKYNTEDIYVKAMFIDSFANMQPYCSSMILSENITGGNDGATNQ